jgi:tetratricopeptide (TPR) repeat protein
MTIFKIIILFFLSLTWGFSQKIVHASEDWFFSSETHPIFFMKTVLSCGNILLVQNSAEKGLKIVVLDSKKSLLLFSDYFSRTIIFWDDEKRKHILLKGRFCSFQNNFQEDFHVSFKIGLKKKIEKSYSVNLKKLQTMFATHRFLKQGDSETYDYHDKQRTIQIQMGHLYPLTIRMISKKNTVLIENITVDNDLGEAPWKDVPTPEAVEDPSPNYQTVIKLFSVISFAVSGESPPQEFLDNFSYKLWNVLKDNPKDEKTRGKLIRYFWKKKDYDQASQIAEEGLNINARSYDLWFWKGIISVCQVKFAIAIPAFEESLKIKPGDFPATFSLAKVYVMLENAESLQKAHALLSAISLSNLSPKERKKCETELRRITELKKTL